MFRSPRALMMVSVAACGLAAATASAECPLSASTETQLSTYERADFLQMKRPLTGAQVPAGADRVHVNTELAMRVWTLITRASALELLRAVDVAVDPDTDENGVVQLTFHTAMNEMVQFEGGECDGRVVGPYDISRVWIPVFFPPDNTTDPPVPANTRVREIRYVSILSNAPVAALAGTGANAAIEIEIEKRAGAESVTYRWTVESEGGVFFAAPTLTLPVDIPPSPTTQPFVTLDIDMSNLGISDRFPGITDLPIYTATTKELAKVPTWADLVEQRGHVLDLTFPPAQSGDVSRFRGKTEVPCKTPFGQRQCPVVCFDQLTEAVRQDDPNADEVCIEILATFGGRVSRKSDRVATIPVPGPDAPARPQSRPRSP